MSKRLVSLGGAAGWARMDVAILAMPLDDAGCVLGDVLVGDDLCPLGTPFKGVCRSGGEKPCVGWRMFFDPLAGIQPGCIVAHPCVGPGNSSLQSGDGLFGKLPGCKAECAHHG